MTWITFPPQPAGHILYYTDEVLTCPATEGIVMLFSTSFFGRESRVVHSDKNARAELERKATIHRTAAREFYELAHECHARADRIMFEEFGRRELEAARRLERCADLFRRRVCG